MIHPTRFYLRRKIFFQPLKSHWTLDILVKNLKLTNRPALLSNGQNRPVNDQVYWAIAIPISAIVKNTRPYLPILTNRMLRDFNCSV
jgi:hypothetical protein